MPRPAACSTLIQTQSPDIAMGVDTGGAGDQGLMFGYACDETPELMPLPIQMAHRLCEKLSKVRRAGTLKYLRPDGKSQVSVEYVDGKPTRIDAVVISTQHGDDVSTEQLRADVRKYIIDPVVPQNMVDANTKYHINPTGRFVIGGPHGDTGLTGRKIIVDTYGGMGRHGGGAFSGKDPTKVDRSACYMARYIAKNIVASGLASRAEVQLAYAIGVAEPVSVMVNSFGTGTIPEDAMEDLIRANFPLTPKGIIDHLKLRRPIYQKTAAFGHFGRTDDSFTWEKTDKADALASAAGKFAQSRPVKTSAAGSTTGDGGRLPAAFFFYVRLRMLSAHCRGGRAGLLRDARAVAAGCRAAFVFGGDRVVREKGRWGTEVRQEAGQCYLLAARVRRSRMPAHSGVSGGSSIEIQS